MAQDRHRSRRNRLGPRARTLQVKRALTISELVGAALHPGNEAKPRTRAECEDAVRPCPWVSCRHHLALDVDPVTGSIKLNFPNLETWELAQTCSLDVAEEAQALEVVGALMNLTRERIRQIEVKGLFKLYAHTALRSALL